MKIVDFHCDTISEIYELRKKGEDISLKENKLHLDIENLKKRDYMLQVFASYVNLKSNKNPLESCLSYIDLLYDEVEKNKDDIGMVYKYEDIMRNIKENKISALLSIEEGGVCKGNLSLLRNFYRLGVRMMTLTWNYENELSYPNGHFGDKDNKKGLKDKGFEFINEMQRKNKDEKISTIIDPVNNGQIIFADNNKDFTQQILDFQGQLYSLHDDAPDVSAEFSKRIEEIEVIHSIKILDRRELGI